MLDRFSRRLLLWAVLASLPAGAAAATVGGYAPSSLVTAAPLLSAAALLIAIVGWRMLHEQLEGQRLADAQVRDTARRLQEAMHASVDGLMILRAVRDESGTLTDFELDDINGTGASLLYCTRESLVGRRLRADIGGAVGERLFDRYAWALVTGTPVVEEVRVDRRHVAAGWLLHQAMPTSDGIAVTARDISSRMREERRLRRASLTDDLTGLANRRGFMALAEQQLRNARRHGQDAVVLYADMDGFKQLNDQHGHAVGDRALAIVGRVLRETVRDCDVVARLGGDEFTILACEADGTGARAIQRRIEERLALVNASGQLPAPLQLTIGFTRVRPGDHAGIAELLARADQLLYSRKRRRASLRAAEATSGTVMVRARRTPRVSTVPVQVPVPATVASVADAAARQLPRGVGSSPRPMLPLHPMPLTPPA